MIIEVRNDTLALSGNVRRNEWHTLEAAVQLMLKRHPEGLILDCSELRLLTSAGAETLREAEAKLAAKGARLVVSGLGPEVARALRSVPNLSSHLPLAESVAAARTSLGLVPRQITESTAISAVVLLGSQADSHAVGAVAQRTSKGDTVLLLYLLQVPRDRSLLSSLGPEEEDACAQMEIFSTALHARGLRTVERVERTRDRAQRLLTVLDELQVGQLVIALAADADTELQETVRHLTREAPCPTLLLRLPLGATE